VRLRADLKTGVNFGGFFSSAPYQNISLPQNQYWVYAEGANVPNAGWVAANGSTFLTPSLEGGANGIFLTDSNNGVSTGQGSIHILGGTLEGIQGTAITFDHTFLPSSIRGVHFEANQTNDIVISNSMNVDMDSILSLKGISLLYDTRNIVLNDSVIQQVSIPDTAKRVRITNISSCTESSSPPGPLGAGGIIVSDQELNHTTDGYDGTPEVILNQLGPICYGQ
jgi:hypothetical protein